MRTRWEQLMCAILLGAALFPTLLTSQTAQKNQAPASYARIAIMRARDESHTVDFEAGYIRHLEWHRQAKDPLAWYSYSVWASTEKQRSIIYATFGHTAEELSNPVSPAEDERDTNINILQHVQFTGNAVYEFLPSLSRGSGVPTPTLRAEYTTVALNYGVDKAFEEALAVQQPKLQSETLWYRLVVGGNKPTYVRLRPRSSLGGILDERVEQALPDNVRGLVAKMTVETLNLRPNMLVNITPVTDH